MLRDYQKELKARVAFIRELLQKSGAKGIVYGNSGGKDCTLVGILCKKACDNVLSVLMPCQSAQNYGQDTRDAFDAAAQYGIETVTVDLTAVKSAIMDEVGKVCDVSSQAQVNIAPRLRMTTLYTIAQTRGCLVAGTGNRSEAQMGYFTKWGDGAYDFNPISDLTVTEVYEFLDFLGAPESIRTKAPSAGLYEGQTDEKDLGISYAEIDRYLLTGEGNASVVEKIRSAQAKSAHKRVLPPTFA